MHAIAGVLDQVVVVGYGTQKKATLIGSVSTLKTSEIIITKNENTANMLTGKIPGLRMVQRTSEPGGYENSFDIRGYGGTPLIVIDGVTRGVGDFGKIDPNEIESISVLKDAAAAIYGVNGASGVILVTTKKGGSKEGKFDINYSINYGIQQFLSMPDAVGPVDFMMLTNEKVKRDFASNFVGNTTPAYSYDDITPWIEGKYQGADWTKAAFNTSSPQIQHNLNISGGTEKVNAFISAGYMKQDGLLKSNDLDYSRWNLRSNINIKITNRLRAQVLLSGYQDTKDQPFQPLWTIFKYAWNQVPINQIYANNNPEYLNVMPDNVNPVAVINANNVGFVKSTQKNVQGQANLEYDIPGISGLKAKAMFNYGYNVADNSSYSKQYQLYSFNAADSSYKASNIVADGRALPSLLRQYYTNASTSSQLSLNYAHAFDNAHHVTGLLVYEQNHSEADNIYAQRNEPLPVDYLFGGSAGAGEQGNTYVNGVSNYSSRSIIGRATYDYKGKYLAEYSFRRDGSNEFKPGPDQFGFFPGYSVGWRISEEPFFKKLISPKWISSLKIRASLGKVGTAGDARFAYLSGYDYPTVDPADNKPTGYVFNGQFINGAADHGLANENITWYTSTIKNLGVDFSVLKGYLEGTFEVFRRDQEGLLAYRTDQLPGTTGVTLPKENLDGDRVNGWELSLSSKSKIGQVGLFVSGNVSSARQMWTHKTQGANGSEYQQWRNGLTDRYKNIWWGVDYGGQFGSYDEIHNYGVNTGGGNNNVVPGDYYMQDWNEDGVINDNDKHPIATFDLPLINFGFNISVTYKGIDLTALFAGATGVYTQYGEQLAEPLMYGHSSLEKFLDSWHTANPDDNVFDPNTQWIAGKYPAMGYNYGNINNSTKAVLDASYVRLKTLELGYTFSPQLLRKAGIKTFRAYLNSYNLLTVTKLEGVDPEHPGTTPNADFNYGLGGYKYPLNRTFNIGASISF
jgi:TonB-linked SusC/RagA family outer membrane protein